MGDSCMAVAYFGATGGEIRIYPYCLLALWNPFSLEGYFAQPRHSGDGPGPFSKQCARLC